MKPPQLEESWQAILANEWTKPYLSNLASFVAHERTVATVYPPKIEVFNAFQKTPFPKVKVVLVGQDPYHGEGQAHGLSFSVKKGVPPPPSLKNIFKELKDDLGIDPPSHGCLESWAEQGILLLNNVLTVRANAPGSHRKHGWEEFTDSVVKTLSERENPVIFLLWGKDACEKCSKVNPRHAVLTSPHPSPFSAHTGFFKSRPFSKINNLLTNQGKEPINWRIP